LRRRHLLAARVRWERNVITSTSRLGAAGTGRILCYHSIGTPEWEINDVPVRRLRRQLELALKLGYRFVTARTIAAGDAGPRDLAITLDDGLLSVLVNGAPVFAELGIPWTLFVVCDWADGRHERSDLFMGWSEVIEARRMGAEIGSHSLTHPDFGGLDDARAGEELFQSRRLIRERTGILVDSFAIPFGQSRNWRPELTRLAHSCGYQHVYAQAVATRTEGTIPRTFLTRFDGDRIFKAALKGAFDGWEEPA
ncbi:MAG TPA: polysaccharide deacetylase family protein, partial [Candidatus Dormibacteraeota bacterium]|nr:polysaccharide deacetylase family protein [Candidatus Dormibacteraeota bacterium]